MFFSGFTPPPPTHPTPPRMGQYLPCRCSSSRGGPRDSGGGASVPFGSLPDITYTIDVDPQMESVVRVSLSPDRRLLITLSASGIMGAYRLRPDGTEHAVPFYDYHTNRPLRHAGTSASLTNETIRAAYIVWEPSCRQFMVAGAFPNFEIYRISLDEGRLTRIVHHKASAVKPSMLAGAAHRGNINTSAYIYAINTRDSDCEIYWGATPIPLHQRNKRAPGTIYKSVLCNHHITQASSSGSTVCLGTAAGQVLVLKPPFTCIEKLCDVGDDTATVSDYLRSLAQGVADDMTVEARIEHLIRAGFTAEEAAWAGFPAKHLLDFCQRRDEDLHIEVGARIICEEKVGSVTYVRDEDPADLKIQYDGGTRNSTNTCEGCLATDGFGEPSIASDSVRFLSWQEGLAAASALSPERPNVDASMVAATRSAAALRQVFTKTSHFDCPVTALAFSQDQSLVLCASRSGDAMIAVPKTLRIWQKLTGFHTQSVHLVAWNRKATLVATASLDFTIGVWDVEEGQLMCSFREHTDRITSLAFNSIGDRLASCSLDRSCRVFRPRPKSMRAGGDFVWSAFPINSSHAYTDEESAFVQLYWGSAGGKLLCFSQDGVGHGICVRDRFGRNDAAEDVQVCDSKFALACGFHPRLGRFSDLLSLGGMKLGAVALIVAFAFGQEAPGAFFSELRRSTDLCPKEEYTSRLKKS